MEKQFFFGEKNNAGGIFFVAKEYPSRAHPKKAVLDFYGRFESAWMPVELEENNRKATGYIATCRFFIGLIRPFLPNAIPDAGYQAPNS